MQAIFCSRDEAYKKPFGAVATGQAVRFALRVPGSFGCTQPRLCLQPDGGETVLHPLAADGRQGEDYVFSIEIVLEAPGLHWYWFDLWIDYKKLYMGAFGNAEVRADEGAKWPLTVYDQGFQTPSTLHGGVMYQIFPDRFLEGSPNKPQPYNERIYRADKQNEPYFWGEAKYQGGLTQDYYGGDFAGIEKRLPFLKALGINWIYLNPIFEAHSNHRYNTADYMKVDPYLGTNDDFKRLCAAAKGYGIRIILDGVFSHTGSDSLYFNREGRYPTVGAWQGPQSRYRDWYHFHPNGEYDSWWGFETLPSVNKGNREFRDFICGPNGVIDYWLSLGASGFRLDVADELPDDFIAEIRAAVKRGGEENLLIGEVWEDAALKVAYGVRRRYFLGGELDGVMNYPFRTAILDYLRHFDAAAFAEAVTQICEHYPPPALAACTTHISTHDTPRAITALAGENPEGHDRNWQSGRSLSREQYHMGLLRMKLAFVLQFTLPGVPCVYYGDEIAMQGYADPFNRGYYDWNSGENTLIPLMMELADLRQKCPAFAGAGTRVALAKNGVIAFEREHGGHKAAVAVNCSGWPTVVNLLGEDVNIPMLGYAIRTKG